MEKKIHSLKVIEASSEHANEILQSAKEAGFHHVIIVGIAEDGEIDVSHTTMTTQDINWYLDIAKNEILFGELEDE